MYHYWLLKVYFEIKWIIRERIEKMDFFLTHSEVNTLRSALKPHIAEYKKGENIKPMDGYIYILTEGLLYFCTENELYERSILRFIRPGEIFTDNPTFEIYNGISYISAKYTSKAAVFSTREFRLYLSDRPLWQERIDEIFNIGMRERHLSVNYMLHRRTIRNRLLCFLRDEARIQQSDKIRVPLPFADLADYLAADRTALMKEIGRMKSDGIISGSNRELTLLV